MKRTLAIVLLSTAFILPAHAGSTSLARIVEPLKSKIQEIIRDCGSRVVSSDQRGGVTPNHRNHRAVDVAGSPRCIYSHLTNWPGGVSTDYSTAPGTPHVHVSYCPPSSCKRGWEWGLRFVHNHSSTHTFAARSRRNKNAHISHPISGQRSFSVN